LAGLATLDKTLEDGKKSREKKAKEIERTIESESHRVAREIAGEHDERTKRVDTNRIDTKYEMADLTKLNNHFVDKTQQEFNNTENGVRNEMDNRFEHQDKVVDNLSQMVRAFQNTLKVLGNDV